MKYNEFNDYELLYLMEEEDEIAHHILKQKYMPFIYYEASSYYKKLKIYDLEELSFEELIAIGIRTLFQVHKHFEEKRGVLFYTFFKKCLYQNFLLYRRSLFTKKNQSLFHYSDKDYEIEDILILKEKNQKENPIFVCEKSEKEEYIHQFIIDLDGIDRSIFELYYNGFHYREIAELLQVNMTKVSTTIRKIRENLKKKLKNVII